MHTGISGFGAPEGRHVDAPKPISRRPLASVAAFYAVGLTAGAFSGAPAYIWLALSAPFIALSLWKRRFVPLLCAVLFLAAGYASWRVVRPADFARGDCMLSGVICAEPIVYDDSISLTLTDVTVDGETYAHKLRLYAGVYDGAAPTAAYGDRVTVSGADIYAPKSATGAGAYDQAAVLWRKGIGALARASAANMTLEPGSLTFGSSFMGLRNRLGESLDALFPEQGALARSLALGDTSLLSEDTYEAFQKAGIVHILAVSGLHVSTLAMALTYLLRKVFRASRRASYLVVLPFLFLYAAMTGFPASILRAALIFALMEAGPLFGRPTDRLTGIAAAYLLLAVFHPLGAFESGFLLSFTAILGIALLCPTLERALRLRGVPVRRGAKRNPALYFAAKRDVYALDSMPGESVSRFRALCRRAAYGLFDFLAECENWPIRFVKWAFRLILASASAVLGMLPVVSRLFGSQTLWALSLNLVAIPVSTLALPFIMLSAALSPILLPAAKGIAFLTEKLLFLLSSLAELVAAAPWSLDVRLPGMRWPLIAAYAAVAIFASPYLPLGKRSDNRAASWKCIGVAGLLIIAIVSRAISALPITSEPGLAITFVDVGQGDGAIVNAQGRVYAVDTGESSAFADRIMDAAIPLEAVFLSHPDDDHVGALSEALSAGRAERVYLPECWNRMEVDEELEGALSSVQIAFLSAGDVVRLSQDVSFEVLHPPKGYAPSSDNEGSLVLLLRYGESAALFLGDLPDSAIDFPIPDCDVIKLAHHGAASSSGALLLLASSPSAAILSVGPNGYGHPSQEVLDRLERFDIDAYRTDERGDITVEVSADGEILVECWLGEETEEQK